MGSTTGSTGSRLSVVLLLAGMVSGLPLTWIHAETETGARQVLIIHSLGRDYPPFEGVASTFDNHLVQVFDEPVEMLNASLELSRFDGPGLEDPLLQYLRAVYPNRHPDLVVPIGAQAGLFYARHRDELFPESPVLLLAPDRRRVQEIMEPGVAVVGMDLDTSILIENVLGLLPETQDIYLVTGVSPMSGFWRQAFWQEWAAYDQLTIHDLSAQSVAETAEQVANLPPQSAVIIAVMTRDAAGVPHESGTALKAIRARSNAPVFGYLPAQMGNGIVGGSLLPTPEVGRLGAETAARILAGESPDNIAPIFLPFGQPMYDWREIKAWDIPHHPVSGTVVMGRASHGRVDRGGRGGYPKCVGYFAAGHPSPGPGGGCESKYRSQRRADRLVAP